MSIKVPLIKCHGSGNDFILIDEIDGDIFKEEHRANISIELCNRHLGFGADGVLFVVPSKSAECAMRMFNPDGSEAKMCGNGIRCVARYYLDRFDKNRVLIETSVVNLWCSRDDISNNIPFFSSQIGPASFSTSSIPASSNNSILKQKIAKLDDSINWYALSITNPHLVAFVDKVDLDKIEQIGIKANQLDLFPQGINCSLIYVQGKNNLYIRTYERGAGITNSCGTAMTASAFVSVYTGICDANVPLRIDNLAGHVFVTASGEEGSMSILSGNATFVYKSDFLYDRDLGHLSGEVACYNQII